MRKFFGSALLSAALLAGTGTAYADLNEIATGAVETDYVYDADQADISTSTGFSDDCCCGHWLDTTYVWVGGDVYKSLGERITNINGGTGALTSSPGLVTGFNSGFGLLGDSRIRGQFGGSFGVYDPRGRLGIVPAQNTGERQAFVTTGLYKQGDMQNDCDRISWGAVVDYFYADDWGVNADNFDLFQFRGVFGFALNEYSEVGVWVTANLNDDLAAVTVAGAPGVRRTIRAMDQFNVYLKRSFESGAQLTLYTGKLDDADIGSWQVGLLGLAPLGDHLSLYANATYVSPSSTSGPVGSGEEQYNFGVGLAYFFGGPRASGLPLLNVANNGSFLITD